ncbi:HAD-IIIC family phosphatase [Flavobacterium paronense]|uniref:HAD-IIIC family phosphatase n=1 Tax=Flavobacterium paronense TaxID=1392775 RepID=UPI0025B432DD|nr:HAD-IIIC family phosphatase [Flavobacterium paronense]MDN3675783.1 HAD-IIIC family phosphatase [Flavobacterium paronense]
MKTFQQIKKNLKNDFSSLKKIKVAVLGDTATQFLTQALKGLGFDKGFDLQIWESDFNQIEQQVSDPNSELYDFKPEIVIVFQSSHKLLSKYNKLKPETCSSLANDEIDSIGFMLENLSIQLDAKIIYYNYTEIDDAVFGSYALKTESSFLFQLRKLNFELMQFATENANFYLCDLSTIQNQIGKSNFFQSSIYINTEMVLSLDALPLIASRTLNIIESLNGNFKKCVILDLDNTIWGGIIGDDGIENIQIGSLGIGKAFSEFQYWIKKLKSRGIIIAVCSKNTESVAKEPFEKHPDMVLRLDDISVFIANWENKADNIRQIQNILNIGFDSMVFLDDNPFERNIVRENIPGITVPELPEDPADYLEYLYTLNLFETVSFSGEDTERTKMYQIEAKRANIQQKFTNEEDFLKSLNMVSLVEPFNKFNNPRVAQLSQRSNQFNLRTIRYTDADIEKVCLSDQHFTFTFTLEDKYGDNGLICVIILKQEMEHTLFVDTWFMSCRVLKRTMENFVLNTLVNFGLEHNFTTLKGEYIPTPKNEMVANHYENLGFQKAAHFWELDLKNYSNKKNIYFEKIIA